MVAQLLSKANNAEWSLRRIKMKAMMRKRVEEKNSLDNTMLALRRTPIKSQKQKDLKASFMDLAKTFEETKALFEETDERLETIRNSSQYNTIQDMPTLEEEHVIGGEGDFQEESTSSEKSESENRKSWDLDDPTVPEGWKTKICPNGGGKMQKKFLDPFGKVCETRKQALQRMMGDPTKYSEEDIHLMKSHMNNKMSKVLRKVKVDERNKMQEAVDELKEIEAKVRMVKNSIKFIFNSSYIFSPIPCSTS